jgi:hypothetical protein
MDVVSRRSTPAPAKNNTIAFSSNKNRTNCFVIGFYSDPSPTSMTASGKVQTFVLREQAIRMLGLSETKLLG